MRRLVWFLAGVVALLIVLSGAAFVYAKIWAEGFSAREQPSAVERWGAREARALAMPAGARERKNPVPNSPAILSEARAHWADHCALCHANDGSGDTEMGKHMYPPAPDMRKADTQNLSDGELFYIIQNGIRLTGMPAWGGSEHDAEDSWKLAHFIRHLPHLTVEERMEMEKLNPRGPAEWKEEEEEEKFLKEERTNEPQEHHHH